MILPKERSSDRNFGLDFVRVAAIFFVLAAHFVNSLEFVGFWGVELFFALSGYLIGHIIYRTMVVPERLDLKIILNFWKRRWYRTLPNYYLVLILMIFFHYYVTRDFQGFSYVLNYLWFGQDILARSQVFYGVSWSLCIEEWFYFLFPLLLLLFQLLKANGKASVLLSVSLLVATSLTIRYIMVDHSPNIQLRGITLARLDAIAFGVLISFFTNEYKAITNLRWILFFIGIISLFCCIYFLYFSSSAFIQAKHHPLLLLFAPCSCALLLPVISTVSLPGSRVPSIRLVISNLSLWSYSIYLIHIPVLITTYHVFDFIRDTTIGNVFSKCLGLALTILLSAMLYHVWEHPLTGRRPAELKYS